MTDSAARGSAPRRMIVSKAPWRASTGLFGLASMLLWSGAASAQESGAESAASTDGDIVVTASRRSEALADLPFNISAFGADQLERGNVNSVTALTQQVPNFTIQDGGARSVASSIPIIRGINASQPDFGSARYFQSPVGFYLGNAPVTGAFPLYDLERVEVLRGPQGTLYGAGALSGAVRIVPASPRLGEVSGFASGSVGVLAHSANQSWSATGALNIPLGERVALRVAGRQGYEAGFIDQKNIFRRENDDYITGKPVLADPADVGLSSGVLFDKDDVNYSRSTSARVSLLWEPGAETRVELGYSYDYTRGNGNPVDNNRYEGGAWPIDPRIMVEPTGDYERSLPMLTPFKRRSHLASLDISHDLGFATLSTTLALGQTEGTGALDQTVALLGTPYGYYYTSSPANPRVVIPVVNSDKERSFTEEIRLVSDDSSPISYIVGAFFQQQRKRIGLGVYAPGASEQSAAANGGSTVPIALGGTYILTRDDGQSYSQDTLQIFKDYSIYGELTWKVTDRLKLTGGARLFHQNFSQNLKANSSFFFYTLDETQRSKVTSQIFKASASYDLGGGLQSYFTFSQGFRRGGANAFPLDGPVAEPRQLLTYVSDRTNNFELGLKGDLGRVYFSANLFYVKWRNPQIDLVTPYNLSNAVVSGSEAESKGVEFEASGPIGDTGLSFSIGGAYARARLSKGFSLPAGLGGVDIPDSIVGLKGDRLPGAPDWSGSATLSYKKDTGERSSISGSFGVDYRSSTLNALPHLNPSLPAGRAPGYALLRANLAYDFDGWAIELYGTNLADKRAVISAPLRTATSVALLGSWGNAYVVNRPREIGLRLTKSF